MKREIYDFKGWQLFIVFTIIYSCINWLINSLVLNDAYYYSAFGNQFGSERISDIIKMTHKFQIIGYLGLPVMLLLKWSLIAGAIYSCLSFFNLEIPYDYCFKIVLIAEFCSICVAVVKLICFIINPPGSLTDMQNFYPLAITQIINLKQIPPYLIYPLQQFNLFEFAYWGLITLGIKMFIQKTFFKSLKITAYSYGVTLTIWVLCIMFLHLQFS